MTSPREDRFFTPPEVPKVDIHVTSLRGGGVCPSQYTGETPDGRAVYVRYRGGWLTIDVAHEPGADAGTEGEALKIRLGPPLDGYLSVERLIYLTGLRVDKVDERTRLAVEDEYDVSGAVTFWSDHGISATKGGVTEFLSGLWRVFPNCWVSQIGWSEAGERTERSLSPGETPNESRLEMSLGQGCPTIVLIFLMFGNDVGGYGGPEDEARHSREAGRRIETVGSIGCPLKYNPLMLSSEFRTGDSAARNWLRRLDDVLDAAFPSTDYRPYDLASGEAVPGDSITTQDDPAIHEWVNAAENRFRYVTREASGGPWVGYR